MMQWVVRTRNLRSVLNDMRQVEIDTLKGWILGGYDPKSVAKTSTHINKLLDLAETLVLSQDILDDVSGLVVHCFVEDLIEPGVYCWVLKCMHSMHLVEWDPSLHHCFFQLTPAQSISFNNC